MHSLVPELFPAKLTFSIPGDPPEWKRSAFLVAIFCVLLVAKICVVLFTDYTKAMKQRNKWWLCVFARAYAGQFIAATETKGELCGRINEEKIKFYLKCSTSI